MTNSGIEVSITAVRTEYRPKCMKKCKNRSVCPLQSLLNRPGSDKVQLSRVSLTVTNATEVPFAPQSDAWELLDMRGFSVGGAAVCEVLLPPDHVQADLWTVSPGTSVRTMLAFPTNGVSAAALIYDDGEVCLRCRIQPQWPQALQRKKLRGKPVVQIGRHKKLRIDTCWRCIDDSDGKKYILSATEK